MKLHIPNFFTKKRTPMPIPVQINQDKEDERELLELKLQRDVFDTREISGRLRQALMTDALEAVRGRRV